MLVLTLGVLLDGATGANEKLPNASPPSEDEDDEAADVKLDEGVAVDA